MEKQRKLENAPAFDMDLRDGKYSKKQDVLAVSGKWIIVFDGKYNYILYSTPPRGKLRRFGYYSTFDTALYALAKITKNDGKSISK